MDAPELLRDCLDRSRLLCPLLAEPDAELASIGSATEAMKDLPPK
jgi:hypothetical protein